MCSRFRLLSLQIRPRFHSFFPTISNPFSPQETLEFTLPIHRHISNFPADTTGPVPADTSVDGEAFRIQTLLKTHSDRPPREISQQLDDSNLSLSHDLVLNVLKRHRSDWKPAYAFFSWVLHSKNRTGFSPDASVHNETLDILGRMKRFQELRQVLDEMSLRDKSLINDRTFGIVVNRLSAAHRVDEAINFFNAIEDIGLERDLPAFQTLLLSLCRHKHVEEAEVLFRNKMNEFDEDIKTWNIILNGWCLLRSLPDSKRLWKDIIASNSRPDKFTYSIFINSLTKSGKATTSMELLKKMWAQGFQPDVAICNTVIDGLCFKKRIPEALRILDEMGRNGCMPNVATYNTIVKHLCKIRRMDKVQEVLSEMEEKGCFPNLVTFGYLLKAAKNREEVDGILERMGKRGCELDGDNYNLILRLFMEWGDERRAKCVWDEMEKSGIGPDKRSYTIVIHGLYDKGTVREALECYGEMVAKGMEPEARTVLLVEEMKSKICSKMMKK